MTIEGDIEELRDRRKRARNGGGEDRIAAQHDRGKLTARERIDYLLDEDTFTEFDQLRSHRNHDFGMEERQLLTDGVVTGYGTVNGRTVFVFAHDFTVFGGSLGEVFADKVTKVMDKAVEAGAPIVGLNDSAGARIQEGVDALAGFARIFRRNQQASGVVPQISAVMGPSAGGAVYSPAMTDFIVMVEETSHMFITGPDVIETVTGEEVSREDLGGAATHAAETGVADLTAPNDEVALDQIRYLLSYLPQNNLDDPPRGGRDADAPASSRALSSIVPDTPREPYDMTAIIEGVVDEESFFELGAQFARELVTGFARLDGRPVGIVANQPRVNAGTLTVDASTKGARFVRTCDAFNIPVVTFVDVPGYMPGTDQEHRGIIRHGAKLLYAFSEATVPLGSVIIRKAYGGAYCVMASKFLGADLNYAWPSAEIAVMGPPGAVDLLYGEDIEAADNPERRREELIEEYRDQFAHPYTAADRGYLDAVIEPHETRTRLIEGLAVLASKRVSTPDKKHGNIPL